MRWKYEAGICVAIPISPVAPDHRFLILNSIRGMMRLTSRKLRGLKFLGALSSLSVRLFMCLNRSTGSAMLILLLFFSSDWLPLKVFHALSMI